MRFSGSLAALTLLSTLGSSLASDVVDLTDSSFKGEVMTEDLALVEFFAPWCGHCKNLAPQYEEAATELKSRNIKLAKVDCTEQKDVCGEYGVNSYPTLKVFRNGVPTDYAGPRKADGIISYMIKQSLPAVSDVTKSSHETFIHSDKVVLVAYGDASHPIPEAFAEHANVARDSYLFGQYTESSLPDLPESVSLPAIILYKSFDEGHNVLPESALSNLHAEDLAEFIKTNSMPLFDEISPENFGAYAEQGLPLGYLFVDPEDTTTLERLRTALSSIAKELKGRVNLVWIDAVKFADHGKSLSLTSGKWPAFVIQNLADQTKFPLSGVADQKSVEELLRKYVKGDLKPHIMSQAVPATQGPVFTLVSDEWDKTFGDAEKDIFVEFYAPWCGHCQRLAPIWDTLGEKYEGSKNVVIAQMDATENDIPPQAPFKVQGFPTIKFRAAGTAEFIDYSGDRSLESLIEFVEANRKSADSGDANEERSVEDDEEEPIEHDEL